MSIQYGSEYLLGLQINSTDLLAGTAQYIASPVDGEVEELQVIVQAAVTTGGPIKVTVNSTDVVGATVTVANAAAAGTTYSGPATFGDASRKVSKGDKIIVTPDPAFATAGAVNVLVRVVGGSKGTNN